MKLFNIITCFMFIIVCITSLFLSINAILNLHDSNIQPMDIDNLILGLVSYLIVRDHLRELNNEN